MPKADTIAIIGAGFSGTLVAAHLLKHARVPLTIHLIDRAPGHFARGVAYGTLMDCHLLNVPAGNMSAFPDDPGHFYRWAKQRESRLLNEPWVSAVSPASFLPRRAYGDYLGDILDEAESIAAPGVRLERRVDEAVGLRQVHGGFSLQLARGGSLPADKIVFALGNFPPGDPATGDESFYRSPRYFGNPWAPNVMAGIWPSKSCLLIGSGLTMVDWVITLKQAGYAGTIHSISRRGLWPQAHHATDPVDFTLDHAQIRPRLRSWLSSVRRYIAASGGNWRATIDALRPDSQTLWKSLSTDEKRRFLRHLRPYWDCHRHRLAPVIAAELQAMSDSGQLIQHTGRILDYEESESAVEVRVRGRGEEQAYALRVDTVLNCSGSESDYRRLESPLIRDLLNQGLLHPDAVKLGLDVAPDGALIGSRGVPSGQLYTLGPPQKGILWETTAVPEIRGQAFSLARRLLDDTLLR